jgi:hypothetical protein
MIRACLIVIAATCLATPACADSRASTTKDGIALTIFRSADKAVLCLSARPPLQLSGEYGIHASWSARVSSRQAKPVELYSKDEHFPLPVRVELPLPPQARMVRVEVGACVENDSCDMVEINYDLRRLTPSAESVAASCRP